MLGKEVPEEAPSAEVGPELWGELAALAAVEPKPLLEVTEMAAPHPERERPTEERAVARDRRESPERPSRQERPRASRGPSALTRFGVPIAAAGVIVLVFLMLLTGGPWGPGQSQNIAKATPQINGLTLNPAYGDIVGGTPFSFTVTVAQNSYLVAKDVRPMLSVTNLTAGTDVVLFGSFDGVTYSLTSPNVTQQGSTFRYDFGTSFQQNVGAGATAASAPTWYVQFRYAVSSLPAPVVTWSAQFVTG
jgi:hypothetical protein